MKFTAEKVEKNIVKYEIEVDPQTFESGMQKSYLKNRKNIAIPGFRKGKAPRKIIESQYGEAVFYEDAFNEVCPDAYDQAVRESGFEPVDRPEIDVLHIGEGKGLTFTATVTVKPDVELGEYKGIEVDKVEYDVTDEDIEKEIKNVQEKNSRWIAVEDRPIKDGDRIIFDYSGYIGEEQFPGGTAEKQTLEIGSGRFIPGFEDQLIGMNAGDEGEIKVTFPEDYHSEDLKGKEATFKVKIHEIKEKELPDVDDEFVKDISEFDTLDEYKKDLREKMQKSNDQKAKAEMENQLINTITQNAIVDIPEVMVERQIDDIVRDFDYRLRYQGMDMEKYLELTNTSLNDFRAQYKDEAYNRIKTQLVLEKISSVEAIEVNDDDMEKEYKNMAEQYNRDIEEIKKSFKNNSDQIKEGLVIQKTVEFLMDNAVFVEKDSKE